MSAELNPSTVWPAPAKLNLFLHITGRRDDGYHLLQTVYQFLDYADELVFTPRTDGQINRLNNIDGVPAEQDLVVRAASLLQQASAIQQGVDIELRKKLPMGGGLGGGSSDAATTLFALNKIWGCGLDVAHLAELGLQLGADVPVFIRGQSAWAEGVGENLTPVDLPEPWFVVLCPPVNVSTAKVFSDPQLIRDCPAITIRDFLSGGGTNVCEPLVRKGWPKVDEAIRDLSRFGEARMTGTGACVFSAFEQEQAARDAWQALSGQWPGFVARGNNTSSLLQVLN